MKPIKNEAAKAGSTAQAAGQIRGIEPSSNDTNRISQSSQPSKPPVEKLMKAREVAEALGISKTAAYRLMGRELAAVRFGGIVRVRVADLEAFIVSRVEGGA